MPYGTRGDATVLDRAQASRKSRGPLLPGSPLRTVAYRLTVPGRGADATYAIVLSPHEGDDCRVADVALEPFAGSRPRADPRSATRSRLRARPRGRRGGARARRLPPRSRMRHQVASRARVGRDALPLADPRGHRRALRNRRRAPAASAGIWHYAASE